MIEKANNFCFSLLFLVTLSFILAGCKFNIQDIEYNKAENALEEKKYSEALNHYEKAIKIKPKSPTALNAARKGARVALLETNDFLKAVDLYNHLMLYSPNESERIESQKKLASIYFEKLSDYPNAIKEYSRLLLLPHSSQENLDFRFILAKAYFYLNNFYQADIEMKNLLSLVKKKAKRFEYLAFQGNIFLTTKKLDEAAQLFKSIIKEYPEEASKENIPLSLAVTYEEKGNFAEAIDLLDKLKKGHPAPDFLELRIKRLKERLLNQPGARGLTK